MTRPSAAPLHAPIPKRRPILGCAVHEYDPIILLGSPYADNAVDRSSEVDMPALAKALDRLGPTMTVADARNMNESKPIDATGRRTIIDQAALVLGELYVHRYLKHTKHAYDPVAALRQLRRRCDILSPYEFHLSVMRIFKQLRDIHTAYMMPRPYSEMVAFLPFLLAAHRRSARRVANYSADDLIAKEHTVDRTVIVHGMLADFEHPHFRPGVEILSWNGLPVQEAILRVGTEEQGSNIHARFALGLRLMTVRWLGGSLPPNEYFVTIFYRDLEDKPREIRFPWRVMADFGDSQRIASIQAMRDVKREFESHVAGDPSIDGRGLVETNVRDEHYQVPEATIGDDVVARTPLHLDDVPNDIFETSLISIRSARGTFEFGLVRIENFFSEYDAFQRAFIKILNAMPKTGIVLDIRSNPGGFVKSAECILQTMTARPITPLPFQFLATPLVEELVKSNKSRASELQDWQDKVIPSADVGNQFSRFGPLTDPELTNAIGQRYYGPVALITDALTYSSGDIFAAGFQDHRIGKVIGVDPTTGGGGANMWMHQTCVDMAEDGGPLKALPKGPYFGAKMHYAIRRCTRVGRRLGLVVEEEGVRCDEFHALTRDDLLHQDVDLLQSAATVLQDEDLPRYDARLFCDGVALDMEPVEIEAEATGATAEILAEIEVDPGIEPVEHVLEVNGVPRKTAQSQDGAAKIGARVTAGKTHMISVVSHRVNRDTGQSGGAFAMFRRSINLRIPGV